MDNENTATTPEPTKAEIESAIMAYLNANGAEPEALTFMEKGRGIYLVECQYPGLDYAEHGVVTRERLGL